MWVLYIEDKATNVHVMRKIARAADCELIMAASGQEGLASLAEKPDLILTDVGLPDMAGTDLIRQIRQKLPDTPVIAVTAHVLPVDQEECMAAGCTAYVGKPFRFADMVGLLGQYKAISNRPDIESP
jgi:CheY-like chemotaxis protein